MQARALEKLLITNSEDLSQQCKDTAMAMLAVLAALTLTLAAIIAPTDANPQEYILPVMQDVTLSGANNLNDYNRLALGYYQSLPKKRSVVQFDLSELPLSCTSSSLVSATMRLYFVDSNPSNVIHNIDVYRVLVEWDEQVATQAHRTSTADWSTFHVGIDGIDADSVLIDTVQKDASDPPGFVYFDILGAVTEWLGQANNYGLLLRSQNEVAGPGEGIIRFATQAAHISERRPRVKVVC